jgi:hypothetical protein
MSCSSFYFMLAFDLLCISHYDQEEQMCPHLMTSCSTEFLPPNYQKPCVGLVKILEALSLGVM